MAGRAVRVRVWGGRYNPKFSSTLVVASSAGAFQHFDVGDPPPPPAGWGGAGLVRMPARGAAEAPGDKAEALGAARLGAAGHGAAG